MRRVPPSPAFTMYRTCLFCHDTLGSNETIEALPIGRRIAYDAERGRLWVVCRKCERWNLTPFEERWEALEQCERAFRGTRLRASTDNIGLARLAEGLELVRIGRAERPELAVWRYGELLGQRRRRQLLMGTAAAVAFGAVLVGGPVAGLYTFGSVNGLSTAVNLYTFWRQNRKVVLRLPVETEAGPKVLPLTRVHAYRSGLVRDGRGGWGLMVAHGGRGERSIARSWRGQRFDSQVTTVYGEAALRAAGLLLPHLNEQGGSRRQVSDAVRLIEQAGSVRGTFDLALRETIDSSRPFASMGFRGSRGLPGSLSVLPREVKLALEMAAHEESERRALEGELGELERAWREAEAIAAIADDLLLPASAGTRLEELRATATHAAP
jgi:hypothetical protein